MHQLGVKSALMNYQETQGPGSAMHFSQSSLHQDPTIISQTTQLPYRTRGDVDGARRGGRPLYPKNMTRSVTHLANAGVPPILNNYSQMKFSMPAELVYM